MNNSPGAKFTAVDFSEESLRTAEDRSIAVSSKEIRWIASTVACRFCMFTVILISVQQ